MAMGAASPVHGGGLPARGIGSIRHLGGGRVSLDAMADPDRTDLDRIGFELDPDDPAIDRRDLDLYTVDGDGIGGLGPRFYADTDEDTSGPGREPAERDPHGHHHGHSLGVFTFWRFFALVFLAVFVSLAFGELLGSAALYAAVVYGGVGLWRGRAYRADRGPVDGLPSGDVHHRAVRDAADRRGLRRLIRRG